MDIVSKLSQHHLDHVAEGILSYLDAASLFAAELVCDEWNRVVADGMLWKKLIEGKVRTDLFWQQLADGREWDRYLFHLTPGEEHPDHTFYRKLYARIIRDIENLENNLRCGKYRKKWIDCRDEDGDPIFISCLQIDHRKIVAGLTNRTIRIWDVKTLECIKVLVGHTRRIECLQFDNTIIMTGSRDSVVRIWDIQTGELVNVLTHHFSPVFRLKFSNGILVTCSRDVMSIAVWDMVSATEINLRKVIAVDAEDVVVDMQVDFDDKYIVTAAFDVTIKIYSLASCELVRVLEEHTDAVYCLQYRNGLVVSGSWDKTIRLWDVESGACLRVLEGHPNPVHCVRFDDKRIVSGGMNGEIKIWDLAAALDPDAPPDTLCLQTFTTYTIIWVRFLEFNEFQIVANGQTIIMIWDFLLHSPFPLPEKSSSFSCSTTSAD